MSRLSRDKGARREREILAAHAELGIAGERVPLSGAARYRGNGSDVDLYLFGPDAAPLCCEVKSRASGEGFTTLERWLGNADALFLRRDRAAPIVVLPWSTWARLVPGMARPARGAGRQIADPSAEASDTLPAGCAPAGTAEADALIAARQPTHGDFALTATLAQAIRAAFGERLAGLAPPQREALEQIATKLARILSGDPTHADHWNDLAGYARLAATLIAPGPTDEDFSGRAPLPVPVAAPPDHREPPGPGPDHG